MKLYMNWVNCWNALLESGLKKRASSMLNILKKILTFFVCLFYLVTPAIIVAITLSVALDYYGDNEM